MLTSSTLGTAFGDLIANDTPLGFGGSTLALLLLLATVIFLFTKKYISSASAYWAAIVITHPIGATMGDFLTKPEGMNLGNIWSSIIIVIVFFTTLVISRNSPIAR